MIAQRTPVRDFDMFALGGPGKDVLLEWKAMRDGSPPIFWTPRNGGHWVLTRGEDIAWAQSEWELFSHSSVQIPAGLTRALPLETDPPRHTALRTVVAPLFALNRLKPAERHARELTIELIAAFRDEGQCEFQSQFARRLPIEVFLRLMGLPVEDAAFLVGQGDAQRGSADQNVRQTAKDVMVDYAADIVAQRRREPRDDFITRAIAASAEQGIPEEDLPHLFGSVLSSGLHTVATIMGFAMAFLARHPEARRTLAGDSALIRPAVDELIRRHSIVNTGRVVTQDMAFGGVEMRAGDAVMLPTILHSLDAAIFSDPLAVDFARPNAAKHVAFGSGIHRCPGSQLGRAELRILLEEWLPRIPDFAIDPDDEVVMHPGTTTGISRVPLVWGKA